VVDKEAEFYITFGIIHYLNFTIVSFSRSFLWPTEFSLKKKYCVLGYIEIASLNSVLTDRIWPQRFQNYFYTLHKNVNNDTNLFTHHRTGSSGQQIHMQVWAS